MGNDPPGGKEVRKYELPTLVNGLKVFVNLHPKTIEWLAFCCQKRGVEPFPAILGNLHGKAEKRLVNLSPVRVEPTTNELSCGQDKGRSPVYRASL